MKIYTYEEKSLISNRGNMTELPLLWADNMWVATFV